MHVQHRPDDPVRRNDDIVLRAGGGSTSALLDAALRNASAYRLLVESGICRSPWTISVHIPRAGGVTKSQMLSAPPYSLYKPYLQAEAADLLAVSYVQIVATTIVSPGQPLSAVDLSHYDVVVDAANETELADRIEVVRRRFTRHVNPTR